MPSLSFESPLGPLTLVEQDGAIVELHWTNRGGADKTNLLIEARTQLAHYFAGTLRDFHLPLNAKGTPFQKSVWDAMNRIPYGQTRTYGEIASEIQGIPRAVGVACGENPIAIILPCHRVMAAGGRTGGYSGGKGVPHKLQLLVLEGALLA